MKTKFLMLIAVIAVISVIVFSVPGQDTVDADKLGKQLAAKYPGSTIGVHSSEENITEQQEIDRSQLVIEGKILSADSYWKIVNPESNPRIFTDYRVQVLDVIKGSSDKVITVTMQGGIKDGITETPQSHLLEKGDTVIMVLGKDIFSIFGDKYTPISVSKSVYLIDESGNAENKLGERTNTKDIVKSRIANLVNP